MAKVKESSSYYNVLEKRIHLIFRGILILEYPEYAPKIRALNL